MNQRAERAAFVAFCVAVLGGVVGAIGYAVERTELVLGLGLAAALFGSGFGLVAWAKSLGIDEHVVEARESHEESDTALARWRDDVDAGAAPLHRRRALQLLFAGSMGAIVVAFVGPLGSLGPKPRDERGRTAWAPGRRLVTAEGDPVEAASTLFDQLVTVFPEDRIGVDDSQVVLMRLHPGILSPRTREGAVAGWVAYSKICTHAGCSVGLFGIDTRPPLVVRELVCPCHQSVFDPADAARPVGGPATRSLPQLPLAVDDEGYLVAVRDFDQPVGPITWDEG